MKYIRFSHIVTDSKDIPDEEIFTTYDDKTNQWAFAMRINGEFTLSQWKGTDAGQSEVKKSLAQVNYAKKNGWSKTGEKRLDGIDMMDVYRCLYCGTEELDIHGACSCRNAGQKSKILSDFIFPNW